MMPLVRAVPTLTDRRLCTAWARLAIGSPLPTLRNPSQHDLHAVLGHGPAGRLDATAVRRPVDQDRIGIVDVQVDAAGADAIEGGERTVGTVDGHVAHAAPGLLPRPGADHLVVGEQGAVEQDDVAAAEPRLERL